MPKSLSEKQRLWHGSVFGGILSAIMSAKDETYGRTRFWEDVAYVCDGLDGREGTILFQGSWQNSQGWVVGLFFDPRSAVSPLSAQDQTIADLVREMPSPQREAATELIRDHMSDETDGGWVPQVTAAFWNANDDQLTSTMPWEKVIADGANLVEKELTGFDEDAIAKWQQDYDAPLPLIRLASDVYQLRIADPHKVIELNKEAEQLLRTFADGSSLGPCQQYLSLMKIFLPHAR